MFGSDVYNSLFNDKELFDKDREEDSGPYKNAIDLFLYREAVGYVSISAKYLFFYLLRHMIKRRLMTAFYMSEEDILYESGLSVNVLNFSRQELVKLGILTYYPSSDVLSVKSMYRINGL